jgi:hypothetical protein
MKNQLRALIVVRMPLLIASFLAGLHSPFGYLGVGMAYAGGGGPNAGGGHAANDPGPIHGLDHGARDPERAR